ncbi:class I adenylate-forming enzyme family protein [Streptomyces sp. NPDC060184]|uniref:class I adenylate-forming enzyme family protein n=1 Tax=Streptomyces sp. NPDC060184 TaxID=3347064 RepID=UPI0036624A94
MLDSVIRTMEQYGPSEAIVFHDTVHTYDDLLGLVAEWREFLDAHDVVPGEVVTLEGRYSPDACAGLLALIERGAIIVPLTDLPAAKRTEFLEVAQVEVSLFPADQGPRRAHRTGVRAGHELYDGLRDAARPGLVLFSSGTTGRSKASVLDFTKVLSRYADGGRPRRILSFLSLDHIGGVNTLLHTLCHGGTVVTVPERTPDAVFSAIAQHRVDVLPTTPTFLNMVLISGAAERFDTSALGLITYGTEPMPLRTLRRLAQTLPGVRMKQTYGLSELGILPTKSRGDETLWVKLGGAGFDYRIVDDILWIKSDMAMLGYLNAEAPFDEEGYFNTQDVVEQDGEWVRILGRRSEIINVGGEKVYPSEVESVLLELPEVAEVTVSGRPSPVTGMVVRAVLQPAVPCDEAELARRARAHCAERLEAFKVPALIEVSARQQHSERFKKMRSPA